MIKQTALIALFIGISSLSIAQDYFVTWSGDTIPCSNLVFHTNGSGYLKYLSYRDANSKYVEEKGKKNLKCVRILCVDSIVYAWMPMKTKKPRGRHVFGERLASGKISVDFFNNRYSTTVHNITPQDNAMYPTGNGYHTETRGHSYRQFTMPDGKTYWIRKKTIVRVLKPYLFQCPAFKEKYAGRLAAKHIQFMTFVEDRPGLSVHDVADAVKLYNSLCGQTSSKSSLPATSAKQPSPQTNPPK